MLELKLSLFKSIGKGVNVKVEDEGLKDRVMLT